MIGVKGQIVIATGPNGVNAQVEFAFEDPAAAPPATVPPAEEAAKEQPAGKETAKARTTPGLIEARGHISKIRLAHEFIVPLPGNEGRFKQTNTRRLSLERRTENQAGGGPEGAPLSVPATPLTPTVENSWLSYEDEEGRFHLRHPQELQVTGVYPEGGIDLLDTRPDGQDVIQISLVPSTGDPQRDRLAADPVYQKKLRGRPLEEATQGGLAWPRGLASRRGVVTPET